MGNSLTCSASDDVSNSRSNSITIAHCGEGLLLETDPLSIAELMIEFPGHFLAHLDPSLLRDLALDLSKDDHHDRSSDVDGASRHKSRRLCPMSAHEKTQPGQIYALLPMAFLQRRLRAQHWSALARLLRARRAGAGRSASSRSGIRTTSKIAPLDFSPLVGATCGGGEDDECVGERRVDQAMVCGSGGGNGRSWAPKLEPIAE